MSHVPPFTELSENQVEERRRPVTSSGLDDNTRVEWVQEYDYDAPMDSIRTYSDTKRGSSPSPVADDNGGDKTRDRVGVRQETQAPVKPFGELLAAIEIDRRYVVTFPS